MSASSADIKVEQTIGVLRLVPVVALDEERDAVLLSAALKSAGLPIAEITFRTTAAADAIAAIAAADPAFLVGAGTILTTAEVDRAAAAGARFIMTPGLNPKVVARALAAGIPIFPGVSTPSDVERAMELGVRTLKFFPAVQGGGTAYLKALHGPYPGVRFVPTGGITEANLAEFLALPNVLACGGSWMVERALIKAGEFAEIGRRTVAALAARQAQST